MIVNIPSESDFLETGLSLLDFAWDVGAGLLTDLDQAQYFGTTEPEMTSEFWQAAKRRLMVGCLVAQQAVEFILKSRIAAVSPFLLVAGNPQEWPRDSASADTPFADFRMIDAQDLVRAHDASADNRLDQSFVQKFDELRKRRNAIMHTVDVRLDVQVADVMGDILFVYRHLFPNRAWVAVRREYLERSPLAQLHSTDFVEERLVWEFHLVSGLLTSRQMSDYFGLPAQPRKYICPNCLLAIDSDLEPRTGVLRPNKPTSAALFCFVCGAESSVQRRPCSHSDCRGNVISDDDRCLTCGR